MEVATKLIDGKGTATSPYIIVDTSGFNFMHNNSSSDVYYILGNNIDLEGIDWIPQDCAFDANLDGQGYSIKNWTVTYSSDSLYISFGFLFQIHDYGVIENLNFDNINITIISTSSRQDNAHIGIVAGYNNGIVSNCNVSGTIQLIDLNSYFPPGTLYVNIVEAST